MAASEVKSGSEAKREMRGAVLDVLKELLAQGLDDAVIELVKKLLARNKELELLLAKLRERKNHGERVSAAQLDMFLAKLDGQTPEGALAEANKKLEETAKKNGGRPEAPKPPKQPPVRRPIPPELPRVDNPIAVPESERPCPKCGSERKQGTGIPLRKPQGSVRLPANLASARPASARRNRAGSRHPGGHNITADSARSDSTLRVSGRNPVPW